MYICENCEAFGSSSFRLKIPFCCKIRLVSRSRVLTSDEMNDACAFSFSIERPPFLRCTCMYSPLPPRAVIMPALYAGGARRAKEARVCVCDGIFIASGCCMLPVTSTNASGPTTSSPSRRSPHPVSVARIRDKKLHRAWCAQRHVQLERENVKRIRNAV